MVSTTIEVHHVCDKGNDDIIYQLIMVGIDASSWRH